MTRGCGRSITAPSMVNSTPTSDLYDAIERAALAAYGELLAPELAHAAATAFARETAETVEDLLHDGTAALREQIAGQLAALNGGAKGKGAKKKAPGRPKAQKAPSKADAAPKAEVAAKAEAEAAPRVEAAVKAEVEPKAEAAAKAEAPAKAAASGKKKAHA